MKLKVDILRSDADHFGHGHDRQRRVTSPEKLDMDDEDRLWRRPTVRMATHSAMDNLSLMED